MQFAQVARSQQARFRETLPRDARTPSDEPGLRHGHLIAQGHELHNLMPELRQPGGALDVFASRGIRWWRSATSGDLPGVQGPTRNLASSQIACVNFLLPLARRPKALLTFVRLFDPSILALEPIPCPAGGRAELVEFEWVGWGQPLEGGRITRGAMQTSADALIVGRTATGRRALVFEWKYCEEYRYPADKGAGPSGVTRRERYSKYYKASDSSFRSDVPLHEFLFEPYYQLMRLRLLADQMRRYGVTPSLTVDDARVVVVRPAQNVGYSTPVDRTPLAKRFVTLDSLGSIMKATLKRPGGLMFVGSEGIVQAMRGTDIAADIADWLDYHQRRYGW